MTKVWWSVADTAIGAIGLGSTERGLVALFLPVEVDERDARLRRYLGAVDLTADDGRNEAALGQVEEYLDGRRRSFELALDRVGTPFQRRVWDAVAAVPYGRTASYADIARHAGLPRAFRAVGAANGDNPLPLIVPCHRIVGAVGDLTGYGGGLPLKQRLLALEGAMPADGEGWPAWAARQQASQPSFLIGPRSTRIFCRPTCRYTRGISRVPATFVGAAEAIEAGFRACKVCQPV